MRDFFFKRRYLSILTLLILGLALIPGISALNITFASLDGATDRDILIHSASGVLLETVNTSSTGVEINQDVILTFKPQTSSIIENPTDWLRTVAFPWVKTNFVALICLAVLLAIIFRGR